MPLGSPFPMPGLLHAPPRGCVANVCTVLGEDSSFPRVPTWEMQPGAITPGQAWCDCCPTLTTVISLKRQVLVTCKAWTHTGPLLAQEVLNSFLIPLSRAGLEQGPSHSFMLVEHVMLYKEVWLLFITVL